ncbi:hypothetical protein [Microbacterium sp. NC79]|uniref:hypothetical protein n=1 Tax=Microbacterium sp. NC79 TaxID=2851009 RepID=UPI001C2B9077|nr:hypothetical protein [Microbacterium sp. NC79]MBV0895844.1 hypothetical protein [Microbacterium sp. NC79]
MLSADATPHRRADREIVGWIVPAGDLWQGVDVLGRTVGEPAEWLDVEERLEEWGISFLADAWTLELPEGPTRVRLVEVTPDGIVVKTEDFGAIDAPTTRYDLPWPAPTTLRPTRADDPNPFFS